MPGVAVVVDSTVGMSPAYAREQGVVIVPLFIQMQGQSLRDGVDIMPEVFYAQLPSCNPLPTTSQPSAGDFVTVYRGLQAAGYQGIVSVHLSAGISGTCNSAELAAQEVNIPVEVIDTRCAASASLFAAEAAIRAAVAGANLAGNRGAGAACQRRTAHYFRCGYARVPVQGRAHRRRLGAGGVHSAIQALVALC